MGNLFICTLVAKSFHVVSWRISGKTLRVHVEPDHDNRQFWIKLCPRFFIFPLQVLHFFIGLGALLSPIIADPFLSETDCILGNATINSSINMEHLRNTISGRHLHNVSQVSLNTQGEVVTSVSYAFWIMAFVNVSHADFILGRRACMLKQLWVKLMNVTLFMNDWISVGCHLERLIWSLRLDLGGWLAFVVNAIMFKFNLLYMEGIARV